VNEIRRLADYACGNRSSVVSREFFLRSWARQLSEVGIANLHRPEIFLLGITADERAWRFSS
jgi:hypothetical protein